MPRYDYECGKCGHQQEHSCSMSAKPDTLPCPCGAAAVSVILQAPMSFVRFREYEFNPAKVVASNGKRFGRSAQQQHEAYRKKIESVKSAIKLKSKTFGKNKDEGFQVVGIMPGEMAESIGEQEGDKEAVLKDPVGFHKRTGTYIGEGE